jgi:hypothetical protein
MEFFHEIWAYKCSVALISAFEIGIFDALITKELTVKDLAKITQCNPVMLGMLLNILKCYGFLEETKEGFRIPSGYISQLQVMNGNNKILSHEKNLMNHWNIPERILTQLKGSGAKQDYIRDTFTIEEQKDYFNAMNERNLELLFVYIRREYPLTSETVMLEYGRSLGGMSLLCKNKYQNINCDICFDKEFEPVSIQLYGSLRNKKGIRIVSDEELMYNGYDFIFLYNSIHYYSQQELIELLGRLYQLLRPGQILCISDIYVDEKDIFYAGVLLDWMTHGGIYQQSFQELQNLIEHTQFQIIKSVMLKQIHNKLLFLTK